jgi:HJR/Mrr/RecB family endonuclease
MKVIKSVAEFPQTNAKTKEEIERDAEAEQLRVNLIQSSSRYDKLTPAQQEALLRTNKYAEHPQPVDYGLSREALSCAGLRSLTNDAFEYKSVWEPPFWLHMSWTLIFLLAMLLLQSVSALLACVAAAIWFSGVIMVFPCLRFYTDYRNRHPSHELSTQLLKYKEAVRLHELYQTVVYEAEQAAHEAQQAVLRQQYEAEQAARAVEAAARKAAHDAEMRKRAYWETLDGYAFEQATAEVLRKHQFTAIVTRGSGDGGVDIRVTRNALKGVVQCKAHINCVGPSVVRDLYGVIHHSRANFGIIVSRGGFTRGAADFAKEKPIYFLDTGHLIAMQEGRDVLAKAFTPKET